MVTEIYVFFSFIVTGQKPHFIDKRQDYAKLYDFWRHTRITRWYY